MTLALTKLLPMEIIEVHVVTSKNGGKRLTLRLALEEKTQRPFIVFRDLRILLSTCKERLEKCCINYTHREVYLSKKLERANKKSESIENGNLLHSSTLFLTQLKEKEILEKEFREKIERDENLKYLIDIIYNFLDSYTPIKSPVKSLEVNNMIPLLEKVASFLPPVKKEKRKIEEREEQKEIVKKPKIEMELKEEIPSLSPLPLAIKQEERKDIKVPNIMQNNFIPVELKETTNPLLPSFSFSNSLLPVIPPSPPSSSSFSTIQQEEKQKKKENPVKIIIQQRKSKTPPPPFSTKNEILRYKPFVLTPPDYFDPMKMISLGLSIRDFLPSY